MDKNHSQAQRQTCVIAANFTVDPITESLDYWLQDLRLPVDVQLAPIDQIMQTLLQSLESTASTPAFIALLVQCEQWMDAKRDPDSTVLTARFDCLHDTLATAAERRASRIVVLICPASPDVRRIPRLYSAEQQLVGRLRAIEGVEVITWEQIVALYPPSSDQPLFDSYANQQAQIPYTPLAFATFGTVLARWLYHQCTPPRKVIVVDCDNTLWSGLAGEAGLDVNVSTRHQELQRMLVEQSRGGRLICLCSKNNPAAVFEILDHHAHMILRRNDIAGWKINWDDKPTNLQRLSTELSLDLNSFVFIDDDAFECGAVHALHPQVLTIQLPAGDDDVRAHFRNIWALDPRPATAEDRQRTRFYQQDMERQRARRQITSLEDFLASLNLSVSCRPLGTADQTRAMQLLERTNQFNLNGRRRTLAELSEFMRHPDCHARMISATDRFGDYGDIGLILGRIREDTLHVQTLLLSCRALGRGVERRVAAEIRRLALQSGAVNILFEYLPTVKNEAVEKFLRDCGVPNDAGRWLAHTSDWLDQQAVASQSTDH